MKSNRLRTAISLLVAILPCLTCCEHDVDIPLTSVSAGLAAFPAYPFGSRLDSYRYGIKPNHITTTQMDNTIKAHYDDWKLHLVVDVPTVSGGKAIKFNQTGYLTVSEGMGYGMLISVLMAGYDPQSQAIFDGLLKTVRARPAYSNPDPALRPYLMDWRLAADGSSTADAGGGWSAMDGDADIAMALLMADRQWGSAGAWNYKQEAIHTINALKEWDVKPDGTTMSSLHTSRTSDYMIGHFRAYAQATGDAFWSTTAIDRAYWLIDRMQTVYSPGVGLVPDFIVDTDTATPRPSPGGQLESAFEGYYFSNGQRDPWRWGTDYVYSGDLRWKNVLTKLTNFFIRDNGGTPGPAVSTWEPTGNMYVGYHLDGTHMSAEFSNPWPSIGMVAGAMNGAQVDPSFQSYVNACWDWLDAKWVPAYYAAELTLLSMVVASGNWWNPTPPVGVPPPASTRIQAENGTLSGSGISVRSDMAGYEGSGFVGTFTDNGDKLTVSFANVTAGTYDIRIRYHAWGAQQNNVVINGTSRDEPFPATGSDWAVKTLSGVVLAGGTNTVAVAKEWGYVDIDYIEIGPGTQATIRVQAENGSVSGTGVSARNDMAGYESWGFVGTFTNNGDKLTVSFANVTAGTYDIRIRYHAWGAQQNNVIINGTSRDESFPATGSDWIVKTITGIALPGGTNNIAISKNWGYVDVDWIEIASPPPPSSGLQIGVNVHTGGGSTTANDQVASVMVNRNLRVARFDYFVNSEQTLVRDQIVKINANGGSAQLVVENSYQWDGSCNSNLAAVEQDSYNQTSQMVGAMKDITHDFEVLNEVQLYPWINNEVPWNSAGTSTVPYAGKPCVASVTAAIRGATRAIHDHGQRATVGVIGRDFGWLSWLKQNNVAWDVTGYHVYPHYGDPSLASDPWFGTNGPLYQLSLFGKPITINEFNCGEIYDSNYENTAGQPDTETCLKSVNKHLQEIRSYSGGQPIGSVVTYELLDEPSKAMPENHFGLMYALGNPKIELYLVTAFAGGTLTSTEQATITSRGLLTDAQIAGMK
jgi:hypothetical protein